MAIVALRWTVRVVLVGFAVIVLATLSLLVVVPRLTHGAALTVLTGSMQPALPVGSVVIEKPVDPADLHVGDIATYQQAPGRGSYVTHRIESIDTTTNPPTFTFKGDANPVADAVPVPARAIRGKVWFDVPYLGRLRQGYALAASSWLIGVIGLGSYSVYQLSAGLRERAAERGR